MPPFYTVILWGGETMQNLILTLALLVPGLLYSTSYAKGPHYPVHIMPDERIDAGVLSELSFDAQNIFTSDYTSAALKAGKRNMDWLVHMNSFLADGNKIALTKPGELPSYPIHKPNTYSPQTIERDYKEITSEIPESMKGIIFGNASFPKDPTEDLETYIHWAKKVDKLYQTAARWNLIKPHLHWYKQYKAGDIRGYYFLTREENLAEKLQSFSSLSLEDQNRLRPLLINICENRDGLMGCDRKLDKAIQDDKLVAFFDTHVPFAKKEFDKNFVIGGVRPDLKWRSSEPNRATIPVRDTNNSEINHFLEFNNEEEWRWGEWQLDLYFTPNADVHVEFVPGSTPHVNKLGGNKIVMDANSPLTEWDVQWTIRHEFGHVLGLPDCYIEFYDSNLQAMVNYQIDTENMMCSRAGRMQEIHYEELKRVYYKQ